MGVALSADVAGGGPVLSVRWQLLARLAVWALAWGAAVAAVFRLPRRRAVLLVLVVAVALRGAALAGPPTTTDDFYRYSWDGRVQAAGVNPYEYTPGSVHLTQLREPWLWPGERPCPLAYRPKDCTRINRSSVPTIYPPLAEAWFGAIYRLTGIEARWKPWQVAGLVTDVAVVALLAVALRRRGRDPRWCALYALCPAPVLEIVNNGHVDGLAILLAVAALAVAVPPRTGPHPAPEAGSAAIAGGATGGAARASPAADARPAQPGAGRGRQAGWSALTGSAARREVVAGALVGAAALVKLFPLLLLVALVAASADRRRRAVARVGGAAAVVVGAGYLPHLLQVGTKVVGFLPGYLREEGYDGAGRYLVGGAFGVSGGVAGILSALAVIGAAVWVWTRRPPAVTGAALLLGTLLLAVSPVQPWYAVTLLAFATMAVEPRWTAVVAAGYPYFFAVILLHPNRTGIGELAYGLAAAAVVAAPWLVRGSRGAARSMEACPPSGC